MDKVEKGIYRMVSPGLEPITMSSDERYLLPGQMYDSVVESVLLEVSIADIGSNPNSLALYKQEKEDYVALTTDQLAQVIKPIGQIEPKTEIQHMKKIALMLGMAETATEDEIVARIGADKTAMVNLATEVETITLASIAKVVETGIADKRFTADKKEEMINLGKTIGVVKLSSVIELMHPATKPTDHLGGTVGSQRPADATITLASLMKQGIKAVEDYKAENPEVYVTLYKEHYEVDSVPASKE